MVAEVAGVATVGDMAAMVGAMATPMLATAMAAMAMEIPMLVDMGVDMEPPRATVAHQEVQGGR